MYSRQAISQAPVPRHGRPWLYGMLLGVVIVAVLGVMAYLLLYPRMQAQEPTLQVKRQKARQASFDYDDAKPTHHGVSTDTTLRPPPKPISQPVVVPQAPAQPQQTAKEPKKIRRASMIALKYERTDEPVVREDEYLLAPGATKIPCVVETKFTSDIDSLFTAKVTRPVYDTATGQHLLIPHGSTVLGKAAGESLIFGQERLPTMSMTLALPDGRSVEIGDAPILDREGVTGLVSSVNHHWMRNFAAALIMGTLKGGQQALQQSMSQAAGVEQISIGMTGGVNQVGQQAMSRAIDTRPTVTVESGEGCQVLLSKPLRLVDYYRR